MFPTCPARLAGQFLNGTHEFSELVLIRMALHSWIRAAQFSRSDRPKRWNLESCGRKNVRAPWTFPFKPARTSSFRPARSDKLKMTLDCEHYFVFSSLSRQTNERAVKRRTDRRPFLPSSLRPATIAGCLCLLDRV